MPEQSKPITMERLYNLGDYKNIRIAVEPSDLNEAEKELLTLTEIFDMQRAFLLHQKIETELFGNTTTKWDELLARLEELRNKYLYPTKEE